MADEEQKVSQLPLKTKADLDTGDLLYMVDNGTSSSIAPTELVSHTGEVTGGSDGVLTIAPDAVTSAKIADNAVGRDQLAADSVDSPEIANDAVQSEHMADASVSTAALQDGCVTAAKFGTGVIDTPNLVDGSVTEPKLGSGAVSEVKLSPDAVSSVKIQSDAVTTAKVADSAITNAKLAQSPAASIKGNASVTPSDAADFTISGLPVEGAPGAGTKLLASNGTVLVQVDAGTLPQGSGVSNTGSNLDGTASNIFAQKDGTGVDFEFRGIIDSPTIAGTENATNIELELVPSSVALSHMEAIGSDGFIGNDTGGSATPSILSGADAAALIGVDAFVTHNVVTTGTVLGNNSGGDSAPVELDDTDLTALLGLGSLAFQNSVSGTVVQPLKIRAVDENTGLIPSTSVPVASITLPFDCTLNERTVNAYTHTAPTGQQIVVDVHLNGTSLFTTKPTIGIGEKDSDDNPAPVFGATTSGLRGDLLEVFADEVGSGTAGSGLDVTFYVVDQT